ncbi:Anoctamin-like protein [Arachis hypogaea]|nr:Anoctamin-like protein [Arachis hypogaea]
MTFCLAPGWVLICSAPRGARALSITDRLLALLSFVMVEVDEKFWEEEEVDRFSKVQESFLTSSLTLTWLFDEEGKWKIEPGLVVILIMEHALLLIKFSFSRLVPLLGLEQPVRKIVRKHETCILRGSSGPLIDMAMASAASLVATQSVEAAEAMRA